MKKYRKPVMKAINIADELLFGIESGIGDGEYAKRNDIKIIDDDEEEGL